MLSNKIHPLWDGNDVFPVPTRTYLCGQVDATVVVWMRCTISNQSFHGQWGKVKNLKYLHYPQWLELKKFHPQEGMEWIKTITGHRHALRCILVREADNKKTLRKHSPMRPIGRTLCQHIPLLLCCSWFEYIFLNWNREKNVSFLTSYQFQTIHVIECFLLCLALTGSSRVKVWMEWHIFNTTEQGTEYI